MKRLSRLYGACFLILGSLFFVPQIIAASFSFRLASAEPTVLHAKEVEVKVNLEISNLPSESYFRAAFQKEGGSTYIGYMKNDRNEWVKIKALGTTECGDYYKVSDTNASSAAFYIKVGEDEVAESGMYVIKSHRYTNTCKSYTEAGNTIPIEIIFPSPTPTPAPTNTPTHTPTTTPTGTNTPTPSRTPTPTRTLTITPIQTFSTDEATGQGRLEVLGEESSSKIYSQASSSGSPLGSAVISTALVALGLAMLSGVIIWNKRNAGIPPESV